MGQDFDPKLTDEDRVTFYNTDVTQQWVYVYLSTQHFDILNSLSIIKKSLKWFIINKVSLF